MAKIDIFIKTCSEMTNYHMLKYNMLFNYAQITTEPHIILNLLL
jgi:hypothetical protein